MLDARVVVAVRVLRRVVDVGAIVCVVEIVGGEMVGSDFGEDEGSIDSAVVEVE